MGIVTSELADFTLSDGRACDIELNEGGQVHIHFAEGFKLDLSVPEFLAFANIVEEALSSLLVRKNGALSNS